MKSVTVLMSTYNGERYLREQIDSILNQKGVNVHLFVRDDGSTDSTLSILTEYHKNGNLSFYTGENLKTAKSFIDMVVNVGGESDYYALSDQDDVWEEDKLRCAVEMLEEKMVESEVVAYFSNLRPVDADLNILQDRLITRMVVTDYKKLITNSSDLFGCTAVFTKELKTIVSEYGIPQKIIYHDLWIAILAACEGRVIFDDIPHILYRQHGNNQIGAKMSIVQKMKSRWRRITLKRVSIAEQAEEIIKCIGEKRLEEKNILEYTRMVANYRVSLKDKVTYLRMMETGLSFKARLFHYFLIFINRV